MPEVASLLQARVGHRQSEQPRPAYLEDVSVTSAQPDSAAVALAGPLAIAAAFLAAMLGQGGEALGSRADLALCALASAAAVGVILAATGLRLPARTTESFAAAGALFSVGAAAIHFAASHHHFEEWWASGTFFVAAGGAQTLWALLVVARPGRRLLWLGVGVNAAIVLLWLGSRTTGLPFGPDAGGPEEIGFADAAATLFEVAIVVAGLLAIRGAGRRARRAGTGVALVVALVAAAVLVLTTASLASVQDTHAHGHAAVSTHPAGR